MSVRFPDPLRPGDRIGVTAPSSGVPDERWRRLEVAVGGLRDQGYDVVIGDCIRAPSHVSAPRGARADELMSMLADPDIAAVVPPWGGELATDLLDLLDFDLLRACEPTWYVGFSDTTTTMLPLTLRTGWATVHGWNLMDTPYAAAPGMLHWLDVVSAAPGTELRQVASPLRAEGWDDYEGNPTVSEMTLTEPTRWQVLGGGTVDVTGTLIGGCIDVLTPLAATPYADVPGFALDHGQDGLVVYLEAAEDAAFPVARALHGLRHAGWFERASAVLVGRTPAPDSPDFTQHDAVADALGLLDLPVVFDVDFGHQQPMMTFVNGATAHLVVDGDRQEITQRLG